MRCNTHGDNRTMPHRDESPIHWQVGEAILTTLSDGYFEIPLEHLIVNAPMEKILEVQNSALRSNPPRIDVNAYLVRSPHHGPVLIDTGGGSQLMASMGKLSCSLKAAGISLDSIQTVLLTHLHGDHCGGLVDVEGNASFPNAEIVLHRAEAAYWLESNLDDAPDRKTFEFVRHMLAPYTNRTRLIEEGEILPGIHAVALPGHTPGHTGYRIGSGPSSVLIWGDIVHVPAVQSALPDAGTAMDTDPALALKTRKETFRQAAEKGTLVAGMHLEFPGLAQLKPEGDGYGIVAAQWIAMQG
jgi:glyoxylase-like metal-dependent hydrolase (beta-lactamase superfamily II)